MPFLTALETDYHVEDQATDWAIEQTRLVNGRGGRAPYTAVRLDIYMFKAPCLACSYYYNKGGYVGNIGQYTGITDVDVCIWTSNGIAGGNIVLADEKRLR